MKKHRKMDTAEEITKRAIAVYHNLIQEGTIRFDKHFIEPLKIKPPSFSRIKKGEIPFPRRCYEPLSEIFNVNLNYLLYGEEPVYNDVKNLTDNLKQNNISGVEANARLIGEIFPGEEETQFRDLGNGKLLMLVPKVDVYTMAGFLENVQDREYIEELPKEEIVVDKYHRGKYLAFEVIGESMTDGSDMSIPHGSIVIGREVPMDLWKLSKIHTHKWDDYIIVHKDGVLVKQISGHEVEKGIITIHSLNEDKDLYPDDQLHVDDISQIYNVIEVRTKRRR